MSANITVNRDSNAAAAALAAVSTKPEAGSPGRQVRKNLVEKARAEAAGGQFAGAEAAGGVAQAVADPVVQAAAREPIDCLTIELPNGRVVEFGPPVGIALTVKLMMFFGGRDPSQGEDRITATMMCIRKIDDQQVVIGDPVTRDKWINVIGDDGLAMLTYAYQLHWPPPGVADLKIVKKTLKTL